MISVRDLVVTDSQPAVKSHQGITITLQVLNVGVLMIVCLR